PVSHRFVPVSLSAPSPRSRSSSLNGRFAASSNSRLRFRLYAQKTIPTKATKARTAITVRRSFISMARNPLLHVLQGGAQHLQIGDQRIPLALAFQFPSRGGNLGIGVGHAERPQRAHLRLDIACVKGSLAQPWVCGHVGFRNEVARLVEVQPVPLVAIAAAVPMQVGSGALAAPQMRMIVDKLPGDRIMAVTLGLRAERADHLRMAVV